MKEFTYRFTEILTSYFSKLQTVFPLNFSSFQTSAMWGFPFTKVIEFLKVR